MSSSKKSEQREGTVHLEERVIVEAPAVLEVLEDIAVEVQIGEPPLTVEQLRDTKKTPGWLFAAAKALRRWPIGRVVSEADYDAAILEAGSVQLSSPSIRTR